MIRKCETLFEGRALTLNLELATFPDGSQETLEIVRHPGGAGVIALNEHTEVCLIHQYRYALDAWLWEIPAGRIEKGEDPLMTAKRELAEEAGLLGKQWQALASIFPSPGICDERIYLYLTRDLSSVSVNHESGEFIQVQWVPLLEAVSWIKNGKICDAKTMTALYLCQTCLTLDNEPS